MKTLVVLVGGTLTFLAAGCARQGERAPDVVYKLPPLYDSLTLAQYEAFGDSGYQALEQGNVDAALAAFGGQVQLIPDCIWGYYNMACAYGRSGQVEPGLEWLDKAVKHGWCDGEHMRNDPDLDTLRTDGRFAPLAGRADSIRDANEAMFARELPARSEPPAGLKTKEAVEGYCSAQQTLFSQHRIVWTAWQYTSARLDLEAQRIAAMRMLPENERGQDFDEGVERVRALTRLKPPYEPWGTVADGAVAEVNRYLAAYPPGKFLDEAKYRGGLASFCRERPYEASSPQWGPSVAAARAYFDQVSPEGEWAGPAEAWNIYFDIVDTTIDDQTLGPRIKAFAEKYGEVEPAMRIAGMCFQGEVVRAIWPIPLTASDIDGQPFTLADYSGHPVLIDFWATWCGPCRGELPFLKQAWEKYAGKGLQIVSVSLDYGERTTPEDYRKWITENGMSWRHVYDQKAWTSDLARAFFVNSIPSPFLVGKNGELVAFGESLRQENLEKSLASLF